MPLARAAAAAALVSVRGAKAVNEALELASHRETRGRSVSANSRASAANAQSQAQ
jgi:hypothetical protein